MNLEISYAVNDTKEIMDTLKLGQEVEGMIPDLNITIKVAVVPNPLDIFKPKEDGK